MDPPHPAGWVGDPRVADVRARLGAAHTASERPTEKAAAKLASQHKLYVRDRIALLVDEGSFVEDGRYANSTAAGLPADGVVTGRGTVDGRPVVVIANDPTVKAGSWGARTVEKIVRATETALREELPVFWLVDSAGARITDQVEMFPGRRGAGTDLPQPGRAVGQGAADLLPVRAVGGGRGLHPQLLRRHHHGRGQRVDVPRVARGWPRWSSARRCRSRRWAARGCTAPSPGWATCWRTTTPRRSSWRGSTSRTCRAAGACRCRRYHAEEPAAPLTRDSVPERESQPFDVHDLIDGLVDDGSFFEVKPLFAAEIVVGFARMHGETVGIVANNSAVKGGVLFSDSADKATRFIWLCDAFSVPLVYLADVPGFMIGSEVERGGIIRHGAKMVSAVASATVPQFCVVVRKAYGAGLYAMGGPGFGPDATIALPTARIAVMGPEAAVNAVYANRIAEVEAAEGVEAREAFVAARRAEYEADVDLERLAADLVIDQVVEADELRGELLHRLRYAASRDRHFADKRRDVPPV